MNGKGDKPRPLAVPYSKYADNYDQINWGKKPAKDIKELKSKPSSSLINPSNIKDDTRDTDS